MTDHLKRENIRSILANETPPKLRTEELDTGSPKCII